MRNVFNLLPAAFGSAIVGASGVSLAFALWLVVSSASAQPEDWLLGVGNLIVFAGMAWGVAFAAFLPGALLVGIPAQLVLQGLGWTSRLHAIVAGGMLSGGAAWMLSGRRSGADMMAAYLAVALSGAVAGLIFRRMAAVKPPPAPSCEAPRP